MNIESYNKSYWKSLRGTKLKQKQENLGTSINDNQLLKHAIVKTTAGKAK